MKTSKQTFFGKPSAKTITIPGVAGPFKDELSHSEEFDIKFYRDALSRQREKNIKLCR